MRQNLALILDLLVCSSIAGNKERVGRFAVLAQERAPTTDLSPFSSDLSPFFLPYLTCPLRPEVRETGDRSVVASPCWREKEDQHSICPLFPVFKSWDRSNISDDQFCYRLKRDRDW
jgi:hypothetical protein